MTCLRNLPLAIVALAVLSGSSAGRTGSASQSLRATLDAAAKLSAPASATLVASVDPFNPFRANVIVNYRVRTTTTGGGNISMRVTSDFAPTGGPSVAQGALTYTCGAVSLGTACSGTQTSSISLQTPVLTLPASACTGGGGACSTQDPNSVTLSFALADDPAYSTGAYSARVTFTISAI